MEETESSSYSYVTYAKSWFHTQSLNSSLSKNSHLRVFIAQINWNPFTLQPVRALPCLPKPHTSPHLLWNPNVLLELRPAAKRKQDPEFYHLFLWEYLRTLCSGLNTPTSSTPRNELQVCVGFRLLPGLLHEDFEAIWAGGRNRKVQAVTAHSPNDGRGVHIFVGNLSCKQLPQNYSKWPDGKTSKEKKIHMNSFQQRHLELGNLLLNINQH